MSTKQERKEFMARTLYDKDNLKDMYKFAKQFSVASGNNKVQSILNNMSWKDVPIDFYRKVSTFYEKHVGNYMTMADVLVLDEILNTINFQATDAQKNEADKPALFNQNGEHVDPSSLPEGMVDAIKAIESVIDPIFQKESENYDKILRKINSRESLDSEELKSLIQNYQVESITDLPFAGILPTETIICIDDRYFSIYWNKGIGESVEDDFKCQPVEVTRGWVAIDSPAPEKSANVFDEIKLENVAKSTAYSLISSLEGKTIVNNEEYRSLVENQIKHALMEELEKNNTIDDDFDHFF